MIPKTRISFSRKREIRYRLCSLRETANTGEKRGFYDDGFSVIERFIDDGFYDDGFYDDDKSVI